MAISLNINGKSHNVNSDPDPATIPSNPGPASKRREPRSFNREALSPDHGPKAVIQTVIQNRALAVRC